MKTTYWAMLLMLLPSMAYTQTTEKENEFTMSIQIRPRAEYRNGALMPRNEGEEPAGFINNRARLSMEYKRSDLQMKISAQHVGVWGQDPQIDKNVTVFLNKETGTDEQAENYNVASRYCGYESAVDRLVKSGRQGYAVTPFVKPFPDSFEDICERIAGLCNKPGKKYIYSYWNEPDHTMHEKGCFGEDAKSLLKKLEKQVRQLCMRLNNNRTLIIVTADHGHIDTKGVALTDYPKICECLLRLPSIEPRALNFFIKPGMEEQFVNEFNRKFSDNFMLLTKEEVLKKKLFGEVREHEAFRDMLGDYLAVATGALCIYNTREEADFFIGAHAGLTEEEMTIPLILVEC